MFSINDAGIFMEHSPPCNSQAFYYGAIVFSHLLWGICDAAIAILDCELWIWDQALCNSYKSCTTMHAMPIEMWLMVFADKPHSYWLVGILDKSRNNCRELENWALPL